MQGMKLVFRLTPAQQSSLDTLLRQQLDPASANYHRWLTPEQYADRFGLSVTELGGLFGVTRQAAGLWLAGGPPVPTQETTPSSTRIDPLGSSVPASSMVTTASHSEMRSLLMRSHLEAVSRISDVDIGKHRR